MLTTAFCVSRQRARELARASASLRASEARYSSLVNLSHDGIAALDDAMRFTFINPRLARRDAGLHRRTCWGAASTRSTRATGSTAARRCPERLAQGPPPLRAAARQGRRQPPLTAIVADTPTWTSRAACGA